MDTIRKWKLYISKDAASPTLSKHLADHGHTVTESRKSADAFIVCNPLDIEDESMWWVSLKGLHILTPEYLLQEGRGPCMKYVPACQTQRKLWVSEDAKAKHGQSYSVIANIIKHYPSKWRFIDGKVEDFEAQVEKAKKQHRAYNIMGIVAKKELEKACRFENLLQS